MRAAAADTLRLLPRAVGVLPRAALSLPSRWRRRLILALFLAGAIGGGYFGWLRDSSLVRVEHVKVVGVSGPGSQRVRAALADTALGMTTLHMREAELEQAVAGEPIVHSISVKTDFPHSVRIEVVQNTPVAVLVVRGSKVPVAADGSLLRESRVEGSLPLIAAGALPSGKRLGDGHSRRLVEVAAAASPALRRQVEDVRQTRNHGYVAQLRGGPEIWIGDLGSIERKWKAATAILADPSSEGADYIDVRIPERAVAGGVEDGAISAAEEQAATATPPPAAPAQTPTAPVTPAQPQGAAQATPTPAPQTAPQQAPAQSPTPSQQPQP